VNETTVRAHLVGKNIPSKVSTGEFDALAATWLESGSPELESWYLRHANTDERNRIKAFFGSDAGATPQAADIAEPESPQRVVTTTYRVLRDTVLARRIKAEQEYRCQLCNARITLADGTPYAEAHHVKPLGRPHSGPDVPENILCVCPNCHVLLDYGAVSLDSGMVKTIAPEYIWYHNAEIVAQEHPARSRVRGGLTIGCRGYGAVHAFADDRLARRPRTPDPCVVRPHNSR
jgi:hypothetical protein